MLAVTRAAQGNQRRGGPAAAVRVVETLLRHGADVSIGENPDHKAFGALSLAVQCHFQSCIEQDWTVADAVLDIIRLLLAAPGGAELSNRKSNGGVHGAIAGWMTCLEYATRTHNWELFEVLKPYVDDAGALRNCEEQRARAQQQAAAARGGG